MFTCALPPCDLWRADRQTKWEYNKSTAGSHEQSVNMDTMEMHYAVTANFMHFSLAGRMRKEGWIMDWEGGQIWKRRKKRKSAKKKTHMRKTKKKKKLKEGKRQSNCQEGGATKECKCADRRGWWKKSKEGQTMKRKVTWHTQKNNQTQGCALPLPPFLGCTHE